MTEVITALTTSITASSLMELLADIVPFIAVMVIVGFGYRLFRRLISGANKGKAKA